MAGSAWPSDRSFKPDGGKPLNVAAVPEPPLGKLFEFDPVVHRRPRPTPQAPVLQGGAVPESVFPAEVSSGSFDGVRLSSPPAPPIKPPVVATAAPAPDGPEERVAISAERLAFLERVEALVAAESRINDLESENKHLISIVSRLQRQLEESNKKGAQKA